MLNSSKTFSDLAKYYVFLISIVRFSFDLSLLFAPESRRLFTGIDITQSKEKESEEDMNRRGNGYLDEATERLRDEQEKDRDPKTAYEDQMSEENQDSDQ